MPEAGVLHSSFDIIINLTAGCPTKTHLIFILRHLPVGQKKDQKSDRINGQLRGGVLIN